MPKKCVQGAFSHKKLLEGIEKLAAAVGPTLGPGGLSVVVQSPEGTPRVLHDGETIAQSLSFENHLENMGAQVVKEAAIKTNEVAGDGTTTAILLAHALIKSAFQNIEAGAEPLALKEGLQQAAQVANAALKKLSNPVEGYTSLSRVASIAAKDTVIGNRVSEAFNQVGSDGVITIDESKNGETSVEVQLGMQFERGFLSPEMADDENRLIAELDHPYLLLTDQTIADPNDIAHVLEAVAAEGSQLLIVAEEVVGAALATLILNRRNGVLKCVAVHPPAYGEGRQARMNDLAVFTGGTFFSRELGHSLQEATIDQLGRATSVSVTRNNTVITGGKGDPVEVAEREKSLRALIKQTDYDFARDQLKERLAKLTCGVATIKVGAATEAELNEKKLRYEDALHSARAALEEGVLPGGGIAYLAAAPAVKGLVDTLEGDVKLGANLLLHTLEVPTKKIAENAGQNGGTVIERLRVLSRGTGFDAKTGTYTNMVDSGIIDSTKATRSSLVNAASAVSVLLASEVCVIEA